MNGIGLIEYCGISSNMESSQDQNCMDSDAVTDKRKLSLISQGISKLPESAILDNLLSVSLKGNVFCELPREICTLGRLEHLNVAANKIKLLPNEIGNLTNLVHLNCSENLLETLPKSLSMVSKLLVLNASWNGIISIPDELRNLKRLENLDLSHNKLEEVPVALICGSKFITHLNLSHNLLKDFSTEPKCSASLKSFKVNNNSLVELPVWMRCLQGVEELYLGDNDFKCVPHHPIDDMMPLPSVTIAKLSINSCGLKNLPISLKHMKNLIYLDAGNDFQCHATIDPKFSNTIWDLAPSLSLSYLKELRLAYVGLPVLPEEFWTCMKKLEILDLEGNAIVWLPDGLSCHMHLTKLILSCNRLALLPSEIGAVKSLRELRLDRNKLHELPETLGSLENLIYVDLYENELSELPLSIGNLHRLKFLDMEFNHFTIDEDSNKVFEEIPADYVVMRENLRKIFPPKNNRLIGSKEPILETSQSCSISEVHSGDEVDESSSVSSDYQPDLHESINNCSVAEEENWDESDGSDNFFDPESVQSRNDSAVRGQWHWARDNGRWEEVCGPVESDVFCPADIHPGSIPRLSKKEEPEANDGQFDDADGDSI